MTWVLGICVGEGEGLNSSSSSWSSLLLFIGAVFSRALCCATSSGLPFLMDVGAESLCLVGIRRGAKVCCFPEAWKRSRVSSSASR